MNKLNTEIIHPSWSHIVHSALSAMDQDYLKSLEQDHWLPGVDQIFNAFSVPLPDTQYILLGESPYPRPQSANGYAFWDGDVHELWSDKGMSKAVNRATSLRNLIKMLLVARGDLKVEDTSQQAIARLPKSPYIETIDELFANILHHGFLLLNATLVLSTNKVRKDGKAWQPFMAMVLEQLLEYKPNLKLILFGNIAQEINHLPTAKQFNQIVAEHPYNLTFISNPVVLDFFRPFDLLKKEQHTHG